MDEKKQTENDSYIKISQVFLQEKKLILFVTIIFSLLCTLFIYNDKPVYEAKVVLAPLSEIDPSFIHLQPVFYLQTGGEANFTLSNVYNLFIIFMRAPGVRFICFHQAFPEISVDDFEKMFTVQIDNSNKRYKFIIKSTAKSSQQAINNLIQFVESVNLKVNQRLKILGETYKKNIFRNESLPQFFPLREDLYPLNQNLKHSNAYQLLMAIYKINYDLSNSTGNSSSSIKLYHEDSPILLHSTELKSKLRISLIIGVLGGLILGFFAGAFRIGRQRCIVSPKLEYQLL